MTRPAPINAMRFSLRTLLIVLLVVPPLIALAWGLRNNPDFWGVVWGVLAILFVGLLRPRTGNPSKP